MKTMMPDKIVISIFGFIDYFLPFLVPVLLMLFGSSFFIAFLVGLATKITIYAFDKEIKKLAKWLRKKIDRFNLTWNKIFKK